MAKNYTFENRKYIIGAIVIIAILLYCGRLFELQVLSNHYKENADSNAFFKHVLKPARGAIYDRNGKLLVFNQPAYDITVTIREIQNLDTLDFCRTLDITPEFFRRRMEEIKNKRTNPGYSRYTPQSFMSQLRPEEVGVFQEKLFKFPGFKVERATIRKYSYNSAAHALGDIAEISKKELEQDEEGYYTQGEYVGKLGVEHSYEKQLRGEKGVEVLLRDAHGRIQGKYMDGALDKKPIPGKNLTLGLDIELQMLAEQLMQNKRGAIVAIDPRTGEILCFVSAPSYDPALMVGRQRGANQMLLNQDPFTPLFNRAIMSAYPPGSTFKTAQGLTFLQEGIIDVTTSFPCYGGFVHAGLRVGCHPHGSPVPFIPSISTSCNAYYCWGLYRMIDNKKKYGSSHVALDRWKDYMVSQGFGYPLGVDLPGEKRGLIPNSEYYTKAFKTENWGALRIISTAIGQGEVLLTPMQIANLAATIGNRGRFITPHIVKEIENDQLDSLYTTWRHTMVDPKYYEYVVEGMRGAVIGSPFGSTCRRANIPGLEICGKTGTAQNTGKDHSIFMGFAPMNNPDIAICVYVENGGFGATYGVPIGALLIEKYQKGSVAPERQYLIDQISNANLMPNLKPNFLPHELQNR
ncbi:penicillin-binding protein 2 [Bacteroides sp. 519]|uniref:penicillin-binding protein 2 n=1 Tax=Bacteroides sp. 519 TaxID=2302937 RepID=UPI0013D12824|nr:penicillin-binding protein 2 [Bacteroides sp. 519]NDV59924.1 penicillin-binding protein 2 [Bacteroides sp. 519]